MKNRGTETIGQRLRMLREENRMTQAEMGKILHLTSASISSYERDEYAPDYMTLTAYIRYFHLDANWVMLGSEDRNSIMTEVTPTEHEVLQRLRRFKPEERKLICSFMINSGGTR